MRLEKLYFGNTPRRNSDHQLSLGSTDSQTSGGLVPDQFWNQVVRQRFLRLTEESHVHSHYTTGPVKIRLLKQW